MTPLKFEINLPAIWLQWIGSPFNSSAIEHHRAVLSVQSRQDVLLQVVATFGSIEIKREPQC